VRYPEILGNILDKILTEGTNDLAKKWNGHDEYVA
jgi:hypothetical protein